MVGDLRIRGGFSPDEINGEAVGASDVFEQDSGQARGAGPRREGGGRRNVGVGIERVFDEVGRPVAIGVGKGNPDVFINNLGSGKVGGPPRGKGADGEGERVVAVFDKGTIGQKRTRAQGDPVDAEFGEAPVQVAVAVFCCVVSIR